MRIYTDKGIVTVVKGSQYPNVSSAQLKLMSLVWVYSSEFKQI